MLTLYHLGGAICAQKVRVTLFEKGVPWESRECNNSTLRDPDYLRLNPNGVVPTLIHDGAVIIESRIISEYINDAFDGPALMPSDPVQRHRARLWSKQIDDSLHLNIFILTFSMMVRESFLTMPQELSKNALPGLRDPIKRRISEEILESGIRSSWVAPAITRFRRLINDMDQQLEQAQYLAGAHYSLADADFTAYLHRLTQLGLNSLWKNRTHIQRWWQAMTQRPSFQSAILDWVSGEDADRYRQACQTYVNEINELIAAEAA